VGADKAADPISKRGYEQFEQIAKANELVYSTQSSAGDEWVPTLMNAQLWRTVRLNAAVLGLFEQFDMPSQPFDMPTESTDPTIYKVAEATAQSQMTASAPSFVDSKPGTAKVTFSAGKMGALSYWSDEMEEDSIIAFEPQIRDQYGLAIAHGIDDILINGDETTGTPNINSEGSAIATDSLYLILDGLRHQPMVTTTADKRDAGALTIDDFGATAALLGVAGKWGLNPADLVWLMDGGVWHKARLLGEVLTQDKFGPMATVFNGQLGSLFGSPIVVSEDYPLTDATGNVDGTAGDNVLGSFMCINKRFVKVGWRRRPRIRVERLPFSDAAYIVGSARFDIGFKEAGGVALSFNVTV
jgi:HK97 family phage major capsid protein